MKTVFRISLFLNLLLIAVITINFLPGESSVIPGQSENDQQIKNHLEDNPEITFLGNSLTAYGNWQDLLGMDAVNTVGICDFTSQQLSWVLDWGIFSKPPKICFINGGQEDVFLNVPVDRVTSNFEMIALRLKNKNIRPVIQSIIPLNGFPEYNETIILINQKLKSMCERQNIDFLDIAVLLSDHKGLSAKFSADTMHLNTAGYQVWALSIKQFIQGIQLN